MTDKLDPKLQEFEAKLRRLKPLDVARYKKVGCRPPGGNVRYSARDTEHASSRLSPTQPPGGRLPTYRIAAYALATAAMAIVVIVWLTPQPQPLSVLPQIEPTIVTVVTVSKPFQTTSPITSPTMRQQLAELLDEMNVSDPIAEEKPNYPVVEIVVCDAPPKPTMPLPFERPWFRGVMEQEMLFMF